MIKGNYTKFIRRLSVIQGENKIIKNEKIISKVTDILTKPSSQLGYEVDIKTALEEVGMSLEEFFQICLLSLEKVARTKEETRLIYAYLFFMKDFTSMIKKQDEVHFYEYLQIIATHLNYEKLERNRVLMRYGDKGKKAYIILNGNIDILIKSPKKVKVYERDYLIYLATLIRYKEFGLVNLVVNDNFATYPIEIIDDIQKVTNQNKNEEVKSFFFLNMKNKSLKDTKQTMEIRASHLLSLLKTQINAFQKKSEKDLLNNVSTDEYIKRLNVINDRTQSDNNKRSKFELIEFTIYTYIKIISKTTGSLFGEVALSDPQALRTATIITSSDCHFGTLNKQSYNLSLKAGAEKQLRLSLHFINSFDIFRGISLAILNKRYFNNFSFKKVNKGSVIISQNTPSTHLALLKEGNYEVYVMMSLSELTQLIKYFYTKLPNASANISHLESSERWCISIMKDNVKFLKFYIKKELIRIREIQCPDIVGLGDFVNEIGEVAFTVECKSPKGEAFELSTNFYNEMLTKDITVRTNEVEFLAKKYDILLQRLNSIRTSKIQSFFDYKSKRDIFDFDIGTEITTAKKLNISRKRKLESKKTVIDAKEIKLTCDTPRESKSIIKSSMNFITISNNSMLQTYRPRGRNKKSSETTNLRHNTTASNGNPNTNSTNGFINLKLNSTHYVYKNRKSINDKFTITNEKNYFSDDCEEEIYHSDRSAHNRYIAGQTNSTSNTICLNDMIWEKVKPKVKVKIPLLLLTSPRSNVSVSYKPKKILNKRGVDVLRLNNTNKTVIDIEKYNDIKRQKYNERRNEYMHKSTLRMMNTIYYGKSFLHRKVQL